MSIWQDLLAICGVLIAAELIARLCSKNEMVVFARGLAVLVLLLSWVSSLMSLDWDFSRHTRGSQSESGHLSAYVQEQAQQAVESEAERAILNILAAAGLEPEKIRVSTDISEETGIELTKVQVSFVYLTDVERARALLKNVLGEEIKLEVVEDG